VHPRLQAPSGPSAPREPAAADPKPAAPRGVGGWDRTRLPSRDTDAAGPGPPKVTVMSLLPTRLLAATAAAAIAPVALLATAASPAPAAGATTAQSAESLYNAAVKAATSKGVHFDSVATQAGTTLKVSGDTGTSSGMQTLTVTRGNIVENVSALVVGSTGYIKGNATALRNIIGLPSAKSSKYAGRWMSFPTSNQALASLVAGLKNSDVANELQMQGPYTYGTTKTVAGRRALAVQGSVTDGSGSKVRVILYVPALGNPQPVQQVTNPGASKASQNIHGVVNFTKWGEKTSETAPSHTVSLLKLAPVSVSGSSSG
jgi:hypothetical protein